MVNVSKKKDKKESDYATGTVWLIVDV